MAMAAATNKRTKPNITKGREEHLPDDVLETILSRLPLKSILSFRAVSKAWNDLTLHPRFGRIHARLNEKTNASLFMWFTCDHRTKTYRLGRFDGDEGATDLEVAGPDLRFPHDMVNPYSSSIIASCDGFFLLHDRLNPRGSALWNPMTGSSAPFHWCPHRSSWAGTTHGICYDSSSDDYKVVCVSDEKWYAVYSCRGRSWTERREFPYHMSPCRIFPGVTVRGVAHWIFVSPSVEGTDMRRFRPDRDLPPHCYKSNDYHIHEIVYFDASRGTFKTIERPDEVRGGNDVIRLTCLDGRLCLYRNSYDCRHLQIWLLKNYNNDSAYWVKLANVRNLPLGNGIVLRVKPLYLTRDQRIVLQCDSIYALRNQSFIMYDIGNETSERVWTRLDDDGKMHSEVYAGLGSLVLPA